MHRRAKEATMYRMKLEIFLRHLAVFVERRRAQGLESVSSARPS